jgi:hypothetical protein
MAEGPKTRWLIQGKGHWIMIASVWVLTFFAGDRFMQAVRGETSWPEGISSISLSLFFGLIALRAKRTKD